MKSLNLTIQNNSRRLLTGFIFLGAGIFLSLPLISRGAATPECRFDAKLEELAKLKQTGTSDIELKLRREILNLVILCSEIEVKNLKGGLQAFAPAENSLKDLQNYFSGKLDDSIRRYGEFRSEAASADLAKTRELAKTIKAWRANTYTPTESGAVTFVLWLKNQNLFRTAQARFGQIEQSIKTLKLNDDQDVSANFETAAEALWQAQRLNEETKQALLNYDFTRASLLTKNSLEALAKTYEAFFNLSEAVNQFLSLTKKE